MVVFKALKKCGAQQQPCPLDCLLAGVCWFLLSLLVSMPIPASLSGMLRNSPVPSSLPSPLLPCHNYYSLVKVGACVLDILCAASEAEGDKVNLVGLAKLLQCLLVCLCQDRG